MYVCPCMYLIDVVYFYFWMVLPKLICKRALFNWLKKIKLLNKINSQKYSGNPNEFQVQESWEIFSIKVKFIDLINADMPLVINIKYNTFIVPRFTKSQISLLYLLQNLSAIKIIQYDTFIRTLNKCK